jgi:DNA-binding response OmpR family regulator
VRVLVADDERDTVTTLTLLLRDEGYEVRTAYNGKDALRAVREFDPDAVVLDIAMPEVSGWDAAREIRRRCGSERPLLIAVTGKYSTAPDRILGALAGFNHYLLKPCDPGALLGVLASLRASR